jgi:hypothetical protein
MEIGATASSGSPSVSQVKPQAEAQQVHRAGRDAKNDGDSDDGAKAAPVVNTSGHTTGSKINTTA